MNKPEAQSIVLPELERTGSIEAFIGSIENDGSPPLTIEELNVAIVEGCLENYRNEG